MCVYHKYSLKALKVKNRWGEACLVAMTDAGLGSRNDTRLLGEWVSGWLGAWAMGGWNDPMLNHFSGTLMSKKRDMRKRYYARKY